MGSAISRNTWGNFPRGWIPRGASRTNKRTNPYERVSHDGLVGSSEQRFYYLLRTRPIPVRQPQLPITKKWSGERRLFLLETRVTIC